MASKIALRLFTLALAAFGMAAAASVQAASRSQFDLICTGTNQHIDPNTVATYVVDTTPITLRLSIDLKTKHWCYRSAGCKARLPVSSVQGDTVHLLAVKTELNEASFDVDRSTGAYVRRLYTPQYPQPMMSKGSCVTAPFTPLK
jgi:hypothetical protein